MKKSEQTPFEKSGIRRSTDQQKDKKIGQNNLKENYYKSLDSNSFDYSKSTTETEELSDSKSLDYSDSQDTAELEGISLLTNDDSATSSLDYSKSQNTAKIIGTSNFSSDDSTLDSNSLDYSDSQDTAELEGISISSNIDNAIDSNSSTSSEDKIVGMSLLISDDITLDSNSLDSSHSQDTTELEGISILTDNNYTLDSYSSGYFGSQNWIQNEGKTNANNKPPRAPQISGFSEDEKKDFLDTQKIDKLARDLVVLSAKKEAFSNIMSDCPKSQEERMLKKALAICKKNNDIKAFERIIKACPDNLIESVCLGALADYALNKNEKVLYLAKMASPKSFHTLLSDCSRTGLTRKKNKEMLQAFKRVVKACPDEILQTIYFEALVEYAINKDEQALSLGKMASPESFSQVMADCVIADLSNEGNKEAFKYVDKNEKKAFERVVSACPPKLLEKVYEGAMTNYEISENQKAYSRIKDASVAAAKETPFAMKTLQKFKAFVTEIGKSSIGKGPENLARKSFNEHIIAQKDLRDNQKIKTLAHTLANTIIVKNGNKNEIQKVINDCPKNKKATMFGEAMALCVEKNNEEALEKIVKFCPDYMLKEIYFDALSDYALNKNEQAFHLAKKASPEAFSQVMADCAIADLTNDKNILLNVEKKVALDRVRKACSPELQEKVYDGAIANYHIRNNKEAYAIIKDASLEAKKEITFAQKTLQKLKAFTTTTNKSNTTKRKNKLGTNNSNKNSKGLGNKPNRITI